MLGLSKFPGIHSWTPPILSLHPFMRQAAQDFASSAVLSAAASSSSSMPVIPTGKGETLPAEPEGKGKGKTKKGKGKEDSQERLPKRVDQKPGSITASLSLYA